MSKKCERPSFSTRTRIVISASLYARARVGAEVWAGTGIVLIRDKVERGFELAMLRRFVECEHRKFQQSRDTWIIQHAMETQGPNSHCFLLYGEIECD